MDAWLVALLVLVSYGALVVLLGQAGAWQRLSVQPVGPLLIWRTLRFRAFIERLSRPRRFWRAFGDLSIGAAFLWMPLMVFLLVLSAILVVNTPPGTVRVEQVIGLPAINPLIPLWYGIFGLAVAIVVHEGCHGILARAESIAVRSVGLLIFVVPVGAFVEPDEAEMRKAPLRKRLRIFAVGPSSNLVLAVFCAFIFSSGLIASAHPIANGAYVAGVFADSPAALEGLRPNTLITAVQMEGQAQPVQLENYREFSALLVNSTPHTNITLHYMTQQETGTLTVQLGEWPANRLPAGVNRTNGYLGIAAEDPGTYLGMARPGARILDGCKETPAPTGVGCIVASLYDFLFRIPVAGLSPLPPERQWLYEATGPAAALGGAYWAVADAFYWLFWLNLMVGVFNVVPMLPLDGGHMFRDGVLSFLRRTARKRPVELDEVPAAATAQPPREIPVAPEDDDFLGVKADRRPLDEVFGRSRDPLERRAHTITVYTSLLMFALIVWPLVWSYASYAFR